MIMELSKDPVERGLSSVCHAGIVKKHHVWERKDILLLIDIYRRYISKLLNPEIRKILIWGEISQEMNETMGVGHFTGISCSKKWSNMEQKYRDQKECRQGSVWPYYDLLENIVEQRAPPKSTSSEKRFNVAAAELSGSPVLIMISEPIVVTPESSEDSVMRDLATARLQGDTECQITAVCKRNPRGSLYVWDHSDVLLLIDIYRKNVSKFCNPGIRKLQLWDKIAKEMNETNGVDNFTGGLCHKKWSNLEHTFRDQKDGNRQTSRGVSKWPYYDLLEEALSCRTALDMDINSLASSSTIPVSTVTAYHNDDDISVTNADRDTELEQRQVTSCTRNFKSFFEEDLKPACFVWDHKDVLLLIDIYRRNIPSICNQTIRKTHIWAKIAQEMNERNGAEHFTVALCQKKWKNIELRYKEQKERWIGRCSKSAWPYYKLLEEIMHFRALLETEAPADSTFFPLTIDASTTIPEETKPITKENYAEIESTSACSGSERELQKAKRKKEVDKRRPKGPLYMWKRRDVLLLIEMYHNNIATLCNSTLLKASNKRMWTKIAKEMNQANGVDHFTNTLCRRKWHYMELLYKEKKEGRMLGRGRCKWPFYNLLEEIIDYRPPLLIEDHSTGDDFATHLSSADDMSSSAWPCMVCPVRFDDQSDLVNRLTERSENIEIDAKAKQKAEEDNDGLNEKNPNRETENTKNLSQSTGGITDTLISSVELQQNKSSSFVCPVCGCKFGNQGKLDRHSIFHTKKYQFECRKRGRSFLRSHSHYCKPNATLRQAQYHEKIHHSGQSRLFFRCAQCPAKFTLSSQLSCHMLSHAGKYPFVARQCNQQFSRAEHLNYHNIMLSSRSLPLIGRPNGGIVKLAPGNCRLVSTAQFVASLSSLTSTKPKPLIPSSTTDTATRPKSSILSRTDYATTRTKPLILSTTTYSLTQPNPSLQSSTAYTVTQSKPSILSNSSGVATYTTQYSLIPSSDSNNGTLVRTTPETSLDIARSNLHVALNRNTGINSGSMVEIGLMAGTEITVDTPGLITIQPEEDDEINKSSSFNSVVKLCAAENDHWPNSRELDPPSFRRHSRLRGPSCKRKKSATSLQNLDGLDMRQLNTCSVYASAVTALHSAVKCEDCDLSFVSKRSLCAHRLEAHALISGQFGCGACGRSFVDPDEAEQCYDTHDYNVVKNGHNPDVQDRGRVEMCKYEVMLKMMEGEMFTDGDDS